MVKTTQRVTLIKSELSRIGGLEKYAWQLAYDFCKLGIPVTLLTTGVNPSAYNDPLLHIVSFPLARSLSILQLLHFNNACIDYLKRHPSSIVFSLDRTRYQTHIRAGNGVHAQYLKYRSREEGRLKEWSFYLNPLHRMLCSIEKKAFEDPDLKILFVNSHMVRNELLNHFVIHSDKINVIHNGVEWQQLQSDFNAWEELKPIVMKKYGLDLSSFQLLFIGHNYQRKGLDKLLLALHKLSEYPFQLSVIGKEKNLAYYQQLAHDLGLNKKVFFFGPSQDITALYQMADALVIPSLYDPFANVTLEALAMGLFVVSSKTNGAHEILTQRSGVVIEDIYDASLFVKALEIAFAHPKKRTSALEIRSEIEYLDFSKQLRKMTSAILT